MLALTALEVALYVTLDFFADALSDIATLFILVSPLMAFDVLTAIYVARSFAVQRFLYGFSVGTLVWGMQLPVLIALTWVAEGPPVLADDSLWNVGVFGWFCLGIVSIPLIGLLSASAGWILDKRKAGNKIESQPPRPADARF